MLLSPNSYSEATKIISRGSTCIDANDSQGMNSDDYVRSWQPGFGQPQDTLFEEVMEGFIGQANNAAGDLVGRANLENRVKSLLDFRRLLKERCHTHITRGAGSRGGGFRGGKGSLCRALLNSGCSQKMMKKVCHSL